MPLSGIRVVDLTRVLAGPFCSMLLADMGAEVIKIEIPGEGDTVRRAGVIRDGISWYFAAFNRNKRSLTLNLRHEEGREVLAKLIANSEVLVENFRPGVLARMGFDETRLKALNPGLVYGNITGFGETGPYRDRPSFDFIAQAMSGLMSVTGEKDGLPFRAGPPIADLLAGLYGALGICAALLAREKSGRGEKVGANLLSSTISILGFFAANYFATGEAPERTGNDHAIVAPYGLFRTKDGAVALAPAQEATYQRLLDALQLPQLREDPDFRTNALRLKNREKINRIVGARLLMETSDYWIARLNAANVPCGQVKNLAEVFADPQVEDQEMAIEADHPGHGKVRMLGFPLKFRDRPCRVRLPAPDLGGDTEAVLEEIGYSAPEIARLKEKGIV